jgi:spore coat polysaccharide biosynthesis protein SpsF
MRVVAIVQARMGSTRLPRKVMADISGQPMLARLLSRLRRSKSLNEIIVATTTKTEDDEIEEFSSRNSVRCFRGSERDLLDRYYRTALAFKADHVVRITSDCPMIDPALVDDVVDAFRKKQPDVDYLSNSLPIRTFPRGLDTEVMRFEALEKAWREDENESRREHVTPYIYRNPDKFRVAGFTNDRDYSYMRWTVDTQDDLDFVRKVFDYFRNDVFSWQDAIAVLDNHPHWLEINRHVEQKVF